jgi:predicted regulator of Ras-like GTPase activity (Roadblock/LC7/MglB family)
VSSFRAALQAVADRVPETEAVMVIGTDGIPIDRLAPRPPPDIETVAAEHTTLLRASLSTTTDTGLGNLRELTMVTERMTTVLVAITPEYFLFAALAPGALVGRARFALRLAGMSLRPEFE